MPSAYYTYASVLRSRPDEGEEGGRRKEGEGGVCSDPHICELSWARRTDHLDPSNAEAAKSRHSD